LFSISRKTSPNFYTSVSQPPGLEDLFNGAWNIRETKNLSEITKKSSIFKDKVIRKIYYQDNWPQNYNLPGQKTKKIILPGLGLKKIEKHRAQSYKTFRRLFSQDIGY
jgi:hypothetical protein